MKEEISGQGKEAGLGGLQPCSSQIVLCDIAVTPKLKMYSAVGNFDWS